MIETAKANGLNDYAYLEWVFTELPKRLQSVDELLPWNVNAIELEPLLNKSP